MSTTVQLQQLKFAYQAPSGDPKFGLRSTVVAANPDQFAAPFLIKVRAGSGAENWERVVALDDLSSPEFPVSELIIFEPDGSPSEATSQDVLVITNLPPEWAPQPLENEREFKIRRSLAGGRWEVRTPFPFLITAGLKWELRRGTAVRVHGTDGRVSRADPVPAFRTSTVTEIFPNATAAEDRAYAIQHQLKKLVDSSAVDFGRYLGGENPVDKVFKA